MFFETFQTTFLATFQVLVLGVSGFILVKMKVLDDHGLDQVSSLLIKFLVPCFIFTQLTGHFDFETYPQWWIFPLISLAMAGIAFSIARGASFFVKDKTIRNEFTGLATFQNSGYIPLMIITTLLVGEIQSRLYVYILLYIIGFNLAFWTFGVKLLTHDHQSGQLWKRILNPPFVSLMGTLLFIFFGLHKHVPAGVSNPIAMFGLCALPVAMLVVGGNLAVIKSEKVGFPLLAWIIFIKLILIPAIALGVVRFLSLEYVLGYLIVIEAATPSAVSLSLIPRFFNVEDRLTSKGLLAVHSASIITMPVFLTLYMIMAK